MRKLLFSLLLALACIAPTLHAQMHPAYGFLAGHDDNTRLLNHLVSFDLDSETTEFSDVIVYSDYTSAADWAEGRYYVAGSKNAPGGGEIPDNLMIFDIESGQITTVAPITGINRFINDMTYDNSRKKMYAVARLGLLDTSSFHALYTIDLTTGVATKIGTDLGRRISTLACTYDGDLYAVDSFGRFCSIDPETAEVTEIGYTGVMPTGFNSMAFDHSTGTLYWACMYVYSGEYMEMDVSDLRTIDIESGQSYSLKSTGNNTQISGLYIPYSAAAKDAPAHVSGFTVTPGANGANTATLAWTNPATLFGGGPLTAITRVEIYRDDVKIKDLTGMLPGQPASYVDELPAGKGVLHKYKIMACNAVGQGAPSQTTVFVGQDVPAQVRNLAVSRPLSDAAHITWEAPAGGLNGGYVATPVRYTVRRMPDGKVVASEITGLSADDTDVTPMGTYTYEVAASNTTGFGPAVVSDPLTLGPAIELPYSCDFTEAEFGDWTLYDANGDGKTWIRERNTGNRIDCIRYDGAGSNQADDYAVLHCANIKAGSSYKVTYSTISYGEHNLEFMLLRNGDIADVAQVVCDAVIPQKYYPIDEKEFTFVAAEGGALNMALHVKSPGARSQLMVSTFKLEEVLDVNLAAVAVSGPSRPVAGNTYTYNVSVVNRGTAPVAGYTVDLLDANDGLLASTAMPGTLEPGATVRAGVRWTVPASYTGTAVAARVVAEGDGVPADNKAPAFQIAVQPAGSDDFVETDLAEGYGSTHPFNAYHKKSASLNIYQASEIGVARGRISRLAWQSSSQSFEVPEMAVKVYMANTARILASDGFLPENEMTLVYDGTVKVEMDAKPRTLEVELDETFLYTGGNLAVLTLSSVPQYVSSVNFAYYTSPAEGNSCYSVASDNLAFNFAQTSGESCTGNSVIAMNVRTSGKSVKGVVTDMSGAPLAGVKVAVPGNGDVEYTDADGRYELEFLADGSYQVVFSCFGRPDVTETAVVAGSDVTLDVRMNSLPVHTLSGSAVSADGQPVAGAAVTVEGYGTLTAVTDSRGCFEINDVIECENLTVGVAKDWFNEARVSVPFGSDMALEPLTMVYSDYAPLNVTAEAGNGVAVVSWDAPATEATLQYDSGVAASQIGFSDTELGTYAIGTAFRQPMILDKIQWMTTSQGGYHNVVNIYIYDLDEDGNPTPELLHAERSVRNVDGEFVTYTLSEPIEAPRGCLVTLNYPGYLSLATDDRSPAAPYLRGTYYFTSDYNVALFYSMDDAGLDANLMLRAIGRPYPFNMAQGDALPQQPASQPDWRKYRLWRQSFNGGVASDEVLVSYNDLTAGEFSDASIAQAPAGVYRYKVAAVMPDGSLSTPSYSLGMLYRMVTDVNVAVSTAGVSGNAAGAEVSLVSSEGLPSSSAVVGESGQVTFGGIWKGRYTLTVSLYGFHTYTAEMDFTQDDVYNVPEICLAEIIADPSNLQVVADEGTAESGVFRWNESGLVKDDFESYGDFERHPSGYVAWNYVDADGCITVGEQEYDFPGRKQPHAFICFNPSATTPSMLPDITSAEPHSGSKMLASFWGALGSDDYVISPRLTYFSPFTFSLYARRRSASYAETFRMGYSTTTADPADFTWGPVCDPEYDGWLKFSLNVPAEARYVAVNSTSEDGFILFLDDFEISSGSGMPMRALESAPEVLYEVELDGRVLGQTEECSYPLAGLSSGEHTASVTAVYGSGRSKKASISFDLAAGIGAVSAGDAVAVTPNPAVDVASVSADFAEARLFSVSGQLLRVFDGSQGRLLRVGDLPRGVHLLSVTLPDGSLRSLRLILK